MILGIIPARLKSTRIPNKPLQLINGIPILVHVIKRALMSKKIDKIIVCTDDYKIIKLANKNGIDAFMTSKKIHSGTERISSFLKSNKKKFQNLKLVVDIQCDEIFLNPVNLDKIINFHLKNIKKYDVVIPHSLTKEKNNKNFVKIVSGQGNQVLYLTRADAPFAFRSKSQELKRHQDFITFKPNFIFKFNDLKKRMLEKYEGIELLRAIENNQNVATFKVDEDSFSINTKKDLIKSLLLIKKDKLNKLY